MGEEYEWPKKWRGRWMVQLLLASCRIPVGLGNVVIRLYIFSSMWSRWGEGKWDSRPGAKEEVAEDRA